ncbi:MAG: hypothetical protein ACE5G2_13035 [Candidatus Krumholzibacteriia bacterium]
MTGTRRSDPTQLVHDHETGEAQAGDTASVHARRGDPARRVLRLVARRPWALSTTVLVLLAAASLLDRPDEPGIARLLGAGAESAIKVLGSIEADPSRPVASILRIQWTSFQGAETYEVRFFSTDMKEVSRHVAGLQNAIVLGMHDVWDTVAPSRVLLWRVVALSGGREIANSRVQTLRLP